MISKKNISFIEDNWGHLENWNTSVIHGHLPSRGVTRVFDWIPQAAEDKKHIMETAYQTLGRSSFFQADLGYFLVVPSLWKVFLELPFQVSLKPKEQQSFWLQSSAEILGADHFEWAIPWHLLESTLERSRGDAGGILKMHFPQTTMYSICSHCGREGSWGCWVTSGKSIIPSWGDSKGLSVFSWTFQLEGIYSPRHGGGAKEG